MLTGYLRRALSPGSSGLSRAQVAAAVPAGSRRPRSQDRFLKVLQADEDLDGLRGDFRGHVLECARILARWWNWADQTTRPTIWCRRCRAGGDCRDDRKVPCLIRAAGISPSTWKKCRRWLEAHGYLGLAEAGSTPEFRPMGLCRSPDDRNTAAVYVLAVPAAREKRMIRLIRKARELTRPPSGISQMRDAASSRAREDRGDPPDLSRLRAGPLKNLSDKALTALARPFLIAGWTVADIGFAIDHRFGGEQWRLSLNTVRRPAGWARYRLSFHLGGNGKPLPSRSQQLEASAPPLPAGWQRMNPLPSRSRQISDAVRRGWRPAPPAAGLPAGADPAAWAARIRAGFTGRARYVQDQLDLGLP